ncbi:HD-GYP domain-containing protein [Salinicola acroporae]|uniref:HD-GYP domain-containing protein n=1 Tax=Salinicola acroporae TaxID=1541440 RepID=UPI002456C6CB|nr:HD domain-containing phosphohydrolase [Salinicola acroporae]
MRLADAVPLQAGQRFEVLNLAFPSGQVLTLGGWVRHVRTDDEWTSALIGCEFSALAIDHERQLWHCVREIERESARKSAQSDRTLQPSALFLSPTGKKPLPVALPTRVPANVSGNVTATRLLGVADYLNAQILALQNGDEIVSTLLSRHTDTLLTLGVQNRESLLYALGYLAAEPVLVQHALNVAVRVSDLARWRRYGGDTLKAITACALVHDLGKALLPAAVLDSERPLDAGQRERLSRHVGWVLERLRGCRWLAPDIADEIIGEANERLDGSGYPSAKSEAELGELGRMMAVVDVIDAMTRARPDRPALGLIDSYRQVLGQPDLFDSTWTQRYIKRFGTTPVGSLVRYASGALAWVQRLDEQGRPDQVHMVLNVNNRSRRLDQLLIGIDIDQLGHLEGMVMPEAFGLSRMAR